MDLILLSRYKEVGLGTEVVEEEEAVGEPEGAVGHIARTVLKT